ncbi:hypothetical protein KSF_096720 [Reticulibacter mediterranei]|uniref:TIR domain-containing protein n=1 Tax=Reticulibacter mediterranei TaxID=2778369 RepID=A0A8J3N5Z7_9CHLR|nr:toll/interleukin-1 receptor domain-containing protein [Reticulibacter mediterranei]GHO99624.1 hypothetical protein KSF_096720 [Reticulibacter mediterranei]
MPEVLKREYAFISYSHKDEAVAHNVRNDLEAAGIATWMDDQLEPGTHIWEQAIRDAMNSSLAVVVIASPHAKEGPYVRGELHLAASRQLEVLPLWVEGDTWIECVPLSLSDTQYIDVRDSHYATGLQQLVKKLHAIIEDRSPRYCLLPKEAIKEYHSIVDLYPLVSEDWKQEIIEDLRQDYVYIELKDGEIAAMRYTAYPSVRALLDDLYLQYVEKCYHVDPFTYGDQWILGVHTDQFSRCIQLLVPWHWLSLSKHRSLADEQFDWSDFPPQRWFAPPHLRFLQVLDRLPPLAVGLVTNTLYIEQKLITGKNGYDFNRRVAEMISQGHATVSRFHYILTLVESPEHIHPEDYQHYFITALPHLEKSNEHVPPGSVTRVAGIIQGRPTERIHHSIKR